jgi:molybdopterin converting factor small subunit
MNPPHGAGYRFAGVMDNPTGKITVRIKMFKHAFPKRETIVLDAGASVRELITRIEESDFAAVEGEPPSLLRKGIARDDLILILNGTIINDHHGLDTPLKEGDEFVVFPVMAGG